MPLPEPLRRLFQPSGMRGRILRCFVLFGAILVAVYALLVFAAMQRLEDNIFIQRLDLRTNQVAAELQRGAADPTTGPAPGPTTEPPPFDTFHTFVGADRLPAELRERIGDWPPGDYEYHDDFPATNRNEHFVAIRDLGGLEDRLYVVYDTVAYEGVETWWAPVIWVLAGGALLALAIGLPLGRRLANQLASPLVDLATVVETSTPEEMPARLERSPAPGEVGVLGQALGAAMARANAFVERERHFTRNASHELRTPLTVIRGATDLLNRQLADDELALTRLDRIERSLDHMEDLIEAFLALAREDGNGGGESHAVEPILRDVMERQAAAGEGVPGEVGVVCEVRRPHRVKAPATIVSSTIGNLLANAVQHTPEGAVKVVLDGPRLDVVDGGPGIPEGWEDDLVAPFVSYRRGGVGLGLAIVREVCDRYGWALTFEAAEGGGTRTRLDFAPAEGGPESDQPGSQRLV